VDAVTIKRTKLNQVKTRAGARKLEDFCPARFAKTTRTVINVNITTVPKRAAAKPMWNQETMAITAMMPPTPSAYLTAGTALIARLMREGGDIVVGSGIKIPPSICGLC
jgi:hypothetical protein